MAIRNAARVLASRFGVVWGILAYLFLFSLITLSVSFAFLLPILRELREAGLNAEFENLSKLIFDTTINIRDIKEQMGVIWDTLKATYHNNDIVAINTALLLGLYILVCRFMVGFYELPAIDVLQMKMSANAHINFMNKLISNVKLSSQFIFAKILYTIPFDILIGIIIYGIANLFGISSLLNLFLPFIIMLAYLTLKSLRYSLIALWSPKVLNDRLIFSSFKYSVKMCFKNFGKIYSSYIITNLLIITVNVFVGIITLAAGLLLTIPISMAFVCALNLTLYFSINDMRFYIDGETVVEHKENTAG